MAEDTQTLTAYHEAGHAIMAVSYGGRIVHVSIDPPDDDGLKRFCLLYTSDAADE